ncbi:MAG: CHASE3 domain-containing protein [Magnetovibrio sp.]|nr:CHASE3 domain-containing protein [Magnetovibrio sp.]
MSQFKTHIDPSSPTRLAERQQNEELRSTWFRALVAGFVILLIVLSSSFWTLNRTEDARKWVAHSFEVQKALTHVLSSLQDAETGQRGFLLTGEEKYLEPFNAALTLLDSNFAKVKQLTLDNAEQQKNLVYAKPLIDEKMDELAKTISLYRSRGSLAAIDLVNTNRGKAVMDELRLILFNMQERERVLLNQREENLKFDGSIVQAVNLISFLLLSVVGTLVIFRLRGLLKKQVEADRIIRQSQKMESLGSLASGIAHDINNMLVPISNITSSVIKRLPKDAKEGHDLGFVIRAAGQVQFLVKKILEFSRQGSGVLEREEAAELVETALALIQPLKPPLIHLNVNIDENVGQVMVDKSQISAVLINLASNAFDAIEGQKGEVTISLSISKDLNLRQDKKACAYAHIVVKDNGQGMTEETRRRAMDPFFTTKEVGKGTGMGLAIAYGIISNHNGRLIIETLLGEGTSMNIYLPLYEDVIIA